MGDERVPESEAGSGHPERGAEADAAPAKPTPGEAPQLTPDPNEITSHEDDQGTEETTDQIQDAFE